MQSFSQCASYRNNRRYYFGLFSYLNGNGNMPKQLTYNQFELEKGDLKTFRNQPQQNVYMVSGKTKNDEDDYSSTILYNNEKITKNY